MSNKSYDSYEMLAKLLNSGEESIDLAYNALSQAVKASYEQKKKDNAKEYESKRNALAANKAKSGKYLDYFMTEKGYEGSGLEADAKMKAQIGYDSDLAALGAAELKASSELDAKQAGEEAELEQKRAQEKTKKQEEAVKMQLQNYWDEKNFEIKQMQAQADIEKTNAETAKKKAEAKAAEQKAEDLDKRVESYKKMLYTDIKQNFANAETAEAQQAIYDSVTGANAEQAITLFGESDYNALVKSFSTALNKKRLEETNLANVKMLYNEFVNAKGEYANQTYQRLKKKVTYGTFPGYTLAQLEEAYKLYKNGKDPNATE